MNNEELKAAALALYKPPFRFTLGYIRDADEHTVADKAGEAVAARIQYLPNAEALQDTAGEIIAEALTEYWNRRAAPPVAAPAASIDTPEFSSLLHRVIDFHNQWGGHPQIRIKNRAEFIAHIDAKLAQASRDKDGNHVDDLRAWLDEARAEHEAQNNAFWATSLKLQEAEASLARLVEGVERLVRYRLHEHTAGATSHRDGELVKHADLLALLPAQAERDAPAPAMGEELPPRCAKAGGECTCTWGERAQCKTQRIIAPTENEDDIPELVHGLMNAEYVVMNGQTYSIMARSARMLEALHGRLCAARACMALRQPGAQELVSLQSAAIESHCKSRNEDAATIAELRKALAELRELHISTLRAPTHFNAYTDIIDKALATAPVSQPAAQEPAFKEVGSFLYEGFAYVATSGDDPRGIKLYRPLSDHPDHKAVPAPLSAPAGSEQEKNAARQAIEAKAEEIYSAWPQAAEYPWQAGGNSHKQEEARDLARAALAAQKEQSE